MVAETIPLDLQQIIPTPLQTHNCWVELINQATTTIHISSIYMSIVGKDGPEQSRLHGIIVHSALMNALSRNVSVSFIVDADFEEDPEEQTGYEKAGAHIFRLNVTRLENSGIVHTKMLVVDGKDFYLGSANWDWRSLAEVKELGICVFDCPSAARDLDIIWESYHYAATTPDFVPSQTKCIAMANSSFPLSVNLFGSPSSLYFASSPQNLNCHDRDWDLDAFQSLLKSASKFVYAEVMDYTPLIVFKHPREYFPYLDTSFREAASRRVQVKLLVGKWKHTTPLNLQYLKSLNDLNFIQVRFIRLPELDPPVPYTRVNHAKFFVADNQSFITTSNWQGDYFTSTLGVSLISDDSFLAQELQTRFLRDWNSPYTFNLTEWYHH